MDAEFQLPQKTYFHSGLVSGRDILALNLCLNSHGYFWIDKCLMVTRLNAALCTDNQL